MATTASAWAMRGASRAPTAGATGLHDVTAPPGVGPSALVEPAVHLVIGPVALPGVHATADLRRPAPGASAAKVALRQANALRRPPGRTRTRPLFGPHAGTEPNRGETGLTCDLVRIAERSGHRDAALP